MTTLQIPVNALPVFMNFDEYTEADKKKNKEAMFRINIRDDEFIIRGDNEEIKQAASGLCHVFSAEVNANPTTPNDFIGLVFCEAPLKFPKACVKLLEVPHKGKMIAQVFLKVGERSMNFGTADKESAVNLAAGLSEFLGLIKKRKGEEYTGTLKFA